MTILKSNMTAVSMGGSRVYISYIIENYIIMYQMFYFCDNYFEQFQ